MANQIAKVNTEKVIGEFTQNELDTLKGTIAKGTTNEQFSLFTQICVNSGLNPFLNHVYCILYNGQMSVQIAVEGILYLARQKEGYKGIEAQLVHENDEFKIGRVDGRMQITVHDFGFPRGKAVGGYAIAKRDGFDDVIVLMETGEVEHMKKGRNSKMWSDYFSDMFKKHMMKRAAKLQFGIEINEDDPIGTNGDNPSFEEYKPGERKEVNNADPIITTGEGEGEQESEAQLMQNQWDIISDIMKEYGLKKAVLTAIIKEKFNVKVDALTLQNLVALTKFVEFEGKKKQEEAKKAEEKPSVEDEMEAMASLFDTK